MDKFTQYYLNEEQDIAIPLSIDFKKDIASKKPLNGSDYESIRDYLIEMTDSSGKKIINITDEESIAVLKRYRSDEEHSSASNFGYLAVAVQKILEIYRFNTSDGIINMFTALGGSTKYYFISTDKKFENSVKFNLDIFTKVIVEQQNKYKEEQTTQAELKASEEKKAKRRESYLKGKPKRDITLAQKKAEAEKTKAEQEEIKKLGTRSPKNGRFGYYDIDFDEYKTLIKTLEEDVNTLTDKRGYVWTTDTRTSEGNKFGEGKFFKIKGADKKKPESIIYLFYYYDKYLPNTGMIIFDGSQAFDDFVEVQIAIKAFTDGKFGRDTKAKLKDYSQVTWIDENPKHIAPPLHQGNADEIMKTQNPPTKKKLKKESTWYERVLLEIQ